MVADAVDGYLTSYIDAAAKLGARHVIVHAGYHFTSDKEHRMRAGLTRLQRAVEHAERRGVRLLLENMDKEPADAEVRYLAHSIEEWSYDFDQIDSPKLGLAFTANHAHLMPEGVVGFLNAIDVTRVGEIRLANCRRNGKEEHLMLGEGDFDFGHLFSGAESRGYRGFYVNAFVSLDAMMAACRTMVELASAAGVEVG